eukprot:TRINITY_DN30571_c0_g1_i1.p1 TRINITY_DN30571_c0_g1~~TRINITY_DN30571_c0_g1_i1.p1  ORF type:complete len:121 (-),score=29.88 TRINITY_DN30571_c0_g1_i1:41-403(-)
MAKWMAFSVAKKMALGSAGALAGIGGAVAWNLDQEVRADLTLHAPHLPWSRPLGPTRQPGPMAASGGGYQVYKQVCAACHSMRYLAFRNLVGVSHTEEEVKEIAMEDQFLDGPDESGEMS